jgi:hypothetical protein
VGVYVSVFNVLKSNLVLLLLALIAFSLVYAYFTINTPLRTAGRGSPIDYCVTPEKPVLPGLRLEGNRLYFEEFFVVLMGKGDNMTADVIPPSAPWTYHLLVVDAVAREVIVNYTTTSHVVRFTPPVFIAPRSTVYYVTLRAVAELREPVERACLVYNIAIYPALRVDALNAIYALTGLLAVLTVIVAAFKPRVKYTGFLGELVVNAKFMWLWVFAPLAYLVVCSTLLDTSPYIPMGARGDLESKLIAMWNYRELVDIDFLAIYGVLSAILYTLLFTYRREIGEEKLRDTLPYPRWKRYFSIITTHLALLYTPLYALSILHLFKQIPHIGVYDSFLLLKYLQHLFVVTIFIYALASITPLVISVLAPRTSISMVASVVLYLLLLYETPVARALLSPVPYFRRPMPIQRISLGWYARDLIYSYLLNPESIVRHYFVGGGRPVDYLFGTPLLYLALVLLCLLIYVRRENP